MIGCFGTLEICQRCIAAILIHFVLPLASHWPAIGLALDQLAILYFIQIPWEHWPSAKDEWEILGKLSAALWELHSDGGHIGCWLPPWFAVNSPWLFPRILSHSCSIWCFPFSRASLMVFQWENPIEMGRIWGARCFPGQGVANPRGEEMRPAHAVPSPMKRPRFFYALSDPGGILLEKWPQSKGVISLDFAEFLDLSKVSKVSMIHFRGFWSLYITLKIHWFPFGFPWGSPRLLRRTTCWSLRNAMICWRFDSQQLEMSKTWRIIRPWGIVQSMILYSF